MQIERALFAITLATAAMLTALPSQAVEKAADNYKTYCAQCHGSKGDGKGLNVRDMSVQPRDHTDTKAMSARSDEQLFKVIKEGGLAIEKSVLMPPWADTFSDQEINDLVAYLRELCQCKFGN